jgi:hypothetical protein
MIAKWTDKDDVEYEIEFVYEPGEPEVAYYSDGSGHPGVAPSCLIETIHMISRHGKFMVPVNNFSKDELESMLEKCFKAHDNFDDCDGEE